MVVKTQCMKVSLYYVYPQYETEYEPKKSLVKSWPQ